MKIVCDWVL